ncbi:MAG: tRNA epoxyqueuosine(34) reductase QueG, partial [Pseudomonadota bacterium]
MTGARSRPPSAATRLAEAVKARAVAEGFAEARIADPEALGPAGGRLRAFVAAGRHGEMGWMADRLEQRADPRALWPETRSVVMVAESYGPDEDPLDAIERRDRGAISVYARNRDYHDVAKKRLKRVARWLAEETGAPVKVFVDTAPVMEKPLGQAAGLGWTGKHSNLVSRRLGSWFFLGALFSAAEIAPDAPESDHCGGCRRCLDICPTAAFPAPYQLDARRCVSYLTIELKGPIPREMRAAIGNRIYGCDDCLAVCPWNKFAETARDAAYWSRVELRAPRLADLAALDDAAFRQVFAGSPIKRIGRDRFVRNVLIAIGNSGDAPPFLLIPALAAI